MFANAVLYFHSSFFSYIGMCNTFFKQKHRSTCNGNIKIYTKIWLWKMCCPGWLAALGALQVVQLCVLKANKAKLNNMGLVRILDCWLCVDSHYTANSSTAVIAISLDSSLVVSVFSSAEWWKASHTGLFFPLHHTDMTSFSNYSFHTWKLPISTPASE